MRIFFSKPSLIVYIVLIAFVIIQKYNGMVTDITTTTIHTSDRCQRSHYATLALRYGATYQIAQDFDLPALKIIGTPTALDNLNSHQEHSFQAHTNDCRIPNLRYHAPNVNDKLAPY
ncbi:MAG: hypothetical protein Q4C68_06745, partial [Moraxella sp.]|nr:hypothetical protein [Moraxella sp.]